MKPYEVISPGTRNSFTAGTAAQALAHYERITSNGLRAEIFQRACGWTRITPAALREAAMVDKAFRS